jgi:hypothetical protein
VGSPSPFRKISGQTEAILIDIVLLSNLELSLYILKIITTPFGISLVEKEIDCSSFKIK